MTNRQKPPKLEKSTAKKRPAKKPAGKPAISSKTSMHGGAREGAGKKPFEPSEKQRKTVQEVAGYGVPLNQVAALIGICKDTLLKHFPDEILLGKALVNSKVGKTIAQQAMKGNVIAAIWWSKSQMGWSEKTSVEVSGPDGGPVEHKMQPINIIPYSLSEEGLAKTKTVLAQTQTKVVH